MKKLLSLILFTCLVQILAGQSAQPPKPNVLLILVDDLGWQDVGIYDVDEPSPYETPNIDKLARRGVLFKNGYSPSPVCSPSRCAIMSGKHPARTMSTTVASGKPPMPHHPQNSLSLRGVVVEWIRKMLPLRRLSKPMGTRPDMWGSGTLRLITMPFLSRLMKVLISPVTMLGMHRHEGCRVECLTDYKDLLRIRKMTHTVWMKMGIPAIMSLRKPCGSFPKTSSTPPFFIMQAGWSIHPFRRGASSYWRNTVRS